MSSMNENLLDKIARADFSMETDFKSVLRKRLFESGANKKSGILQFQRLSDMELDMVSAAGDMDFKTAHRGFFRAWKGLSWHRPSFLL